MTGGGPAKARSGPVDYYQRQARRYPYVLKVDIALLPSIDRAIPGGQLRRFNDGQRAFAQEPC